MPAQQKPQPLLIEKWMSGLYTQRNALVTPFTYAGLNVITRYDSLIDGLNVETTPRFTLARRAGFARYCPTAFGASEYPLSFSSFRNNSGTLTALVDTNQKVSSFTTSSLTTLFTKGTTNQTSFQGVGNNLFFSNGVDAKWWNGTTTNDIGFPAPTTAPTISMGTGSLSPTKGFQWAYCYKSSTSGHVSTASPVSASSLIQTSKQFTLQGNGTTNAQVDLIDIYRTMDAGSVYYYLATIANPGAGTWTYVDNNADTSLNTFILAPRNHANDPAPTGMNLLTFYMGRLWCSVGNLLYFAGGPDVTNGVGTMAWPPANNLTFPGQITALAPTNAGLLVFTSAGIYIVLGSDSSSFYQKPLLSGFGVLNQNCVAQDSDTLYVYTTNRQLYSLSLDNTMEESGFAVGNLLSAGYDPTSSYVTLHRSGTDTALWIGDGSTNALRYSISNKAWSTTFQAVGGVRALKSIEVSPGLTRLLAGRATGSGYLLNRDLSTWQDDGTAYSAFATVGSLRLSAPGSPLLSVESIVYERSSAGSDFTVSVLLNEISGSFTSLGQSSSPVQDPWSIPQATSLKTWRCDLKSSSTPLPQLARHMQVKITFATENAASELLGLSVLPSAEQPIQA